MGQKRYVNPDSPIEGWQRAQKAALDKGAMTAFVHELSQAVGGWPCVGSSATSNWVEDLAKALNASFSTNSDRQRLGFLAYTGKVEGTVRDEVLWQLTHSPLPSLGTSARWIGREFERVDGVMGPGTGGALAIAAFQAKQLYVADLFDPGNRLLQDLNLDIRLKAPWNLRNRSPSVQVGLVLVLDCGHSPLPKLPSRAYAQLIDRQQSHHTWSADWAAALTQRLSDLQLSLAHTGHWTLQTPNHGSRAFALHWFLVTPTPHSTLQTSASDADRQKVAVD